MADPNVEAARVVGRRAELGWFEVEFIMFGCAYLLDGNVHYKVSSQAEDIYHFVESAAVEKIYTSNVLRYSEKCSVPSGMHDLIATDVKKDLARELRRRYSPAFFAELQNLAESTEQNGAVDLLWEEADALEGVFSEEKLDEFEMLVAYAYMHNGVDLPTYRNLMKWIHEERKNMDDRPISKDFYEKTIYGFAYEKDGSIKYVDNVLLSYIYEKMEQIEQEGYITTPILSHTFWFEQNRQTAQVVREFKALMEEKYDRAYMEKIKAIRKSRAMISEEDMLQQIASVQEQYGEHAARTMLRYAYNRGLLKRENA